MLPAHEVSRWDGEARMSQEDMLVCGSIFMACAMVEDVVRVVATIFQSTSVHCTRLQPVLASNSNGVP
jgi:hypothetical protein